MTNPNTLKADAEKILDRLQAMGSGRGEIQNTHLEGFLCYMLGRSYWAEEEVRRFLVDSLDGYEDYAFGFKKENRK